MEENETKFEKSVVAIQPLNSIKYMGNNRRQDQIFDSQLLFMGHLLIGILTFGTKRGSGKFFMKVLSIHRKGERILSRLKSLG